MHEIITLQLGQRSNYLATHFWNTQESYFTYAPDQYPLVDHDIHFRPGIGADGTETYTPRTLIYDLKGGFGSMRKINALYEVDEPAVPQGLWNGPTVVQRQTAIQQNEYQRSLEEGSAPPQLTTQSVKYWSDYNRVFFHPRSIVQLNEFELNSTLMPFENWSVGEDLFNSLDKEHDLLDRDLRYFAEEADQLQGIQLMTGIDDAWGGFAARYLDRIRDEYGKTSVLVWGLEDNIRTIPREKRFLKLSNTARSISEMASQASVFVPMALPSAALPSYVTLAPHSQWHVSGLLSSAMESMSLPSRLKVQGSARQTFDQLSFALNVNGNQTIAKLRMSVDQNSALNGHGHPQAVNGEVQISDSRVPLGNGHVNDSDLNEEGEPQTFDMDFFPTETGERSRGRRSNKVHVFGQAENFRGDEDNGQTQTIGEDEGYERARRRAAGLPIIQRTRIPMSFPLLDSFPPIFAEVSATPPAIAVSTSLSTDTSVALRVKSLQQIVGRAIGVEEREALSNSLGEIAEAYEEGYDSGSDEDDD
ncbi:Protein dml-1 [Lachnellula suecica]|uniref:Protein dml-1 n=1 Tax=Lachnellula suecica TaxID=602035 RepID=A0A8T9C7P2_9HELO|nr:Protein dml-1 [Lachnellula suecica]